MEVVNRIFHRPLFFTKTPESVFLMVYYNSTMIVGEKAIVWWLGYPEQNGALILFDYNLAHETFWVSNRLIDMMDEFPWFDQKLFFSQMIEKHLNIKNVRII